MSDSSRNALETMGKSAESLPPGWIIVGFAAGVVLASLVCGALIWLDVPAIIFPPLTPTPTLTATPTPTPTRTPTPTITPTPAALDFAWSTIRWAPLHDNPTIAVGTIRLLIDGGFPPYRVLHNGWEVNPSDGVFYITIQTPNCVPVSGSIEVRSNDGQRMVRTYILGADEVPCPTPTPAR